MVEYSQLLMNCYKGLPGPYIKYFLKAIGTEGLYKMITPFEDHSAIAQCIIGLEGSDDEPKLFIGRTEGTIVKPRGDSGFGYDSCVKINILRNTYGEITKEEKNEVSHRMRATKLMVEYLKTTF